MITVEVNLYATLKDYSPADNGGKFSCELEPGTTLSELCAELEIPEEETKMMFVNNQRQKEDYVLNEGDRVGIFPPVAGGR